jgi:phosphatidylglycerol:prolipoprotein diacylglycerol transferase
VYPVLVDIAGVPVRTYTVLAVLACVAGTLTAYALARRYDPELALPPQLPLWAFVGGLLGGKLAYLVSVAGWAEAWRIIFFWQGGLVSYGAIAGAGVATLILLRWKQVPLLRALDVLAPALALTEAIARFGCFLNGCCSGTICTFPWAVNNTAGMAVHPVQLYYMGTLVIGSACTVLVLRSHPRPGTVVCSYVALYSLLRLILDFFRASPADEAAWISSAQIGAAIVFVLALCAATARGSKVSKMVESPQGKRSTE